MENSSPQHTYQIKVFLRGISPMIWRRLLMSGQETLGELHRVIQVAFDWTDVHLHRFDIHGRSYGLSRPGGLWFEDADQVSLVGLELREGQKFLYTYDFRDGWEHDVRIEAISPAGEKQSLPTCTGGSGRAPFEGYGGPWEYQKLIATCRRAPLDEYLRLCLRLGELFDPSAFDRGVVNEKLQSGYWPQEVIQLGEGPERKVLRKLLALVDPDFEDDF